MYLVTRDEPFQGGRRLGSVGQDGGGGVVVPFVSWADARFVREGPMIRASVCGVNVA